MKLDTPKRCRLYCRRCDTVHPFQFGYRSREYEADCGQRIHPLTLWALYSVDNFVYPPEIMLPEELRISRKDR